MDREVFARLVSQDPAQSLSARELILPLFNNSDYIVTLIEMLREEAGNRDATAIGITFCVLEMTRTKFLSHSDCSDLHRAVLVNHLFPFLFQMDSTLQPYILDAFGHLLQAGVSLRECLDFSLALLADPGSPFEAYLTALSFLEKFVATFPRDFVGEELVTLFRAFLDIVIPRLQSWFGELDAAFSLELVSKCSRCMARFLALDWLNSVTLFEDDVTAPVSRCWECGVTALMNHASDDSIQIAIRKARIVRSYSRVIVCHPHAWFSIWPDALSVDLGTLAIDGVQATEHSFLKTAFLRLLLSIFRTDSAINTELSVRLSLEFFVGAARLTAVDLEEFEASPLIYLESCLLCQRNATESSPRSILCEIFAELAPEVVTSLGEALLAIAEGLDVDAEREPVVFLLDSIPSTIEYPDTETMVGLAQLRLASEPPDPVAATLLLFLSHHSDPDVDVSELALSYMGSNSIVVRHAAFELFQLRTDFSAFLRPPTEALAENSRNVTTALFSLALESWHGHLLPLFRTLANLNPAVFVENALDVAHCLLQISLNAENEDERDVIQLIHLVLDIFPKDSLVFAECTSILSEGLQSTTVDHTCSILLQWAIIIAAKSTHFPVEFVWLLSSCCKHMIEGSEPLRIEVTEFCVFAIQSSNFLQVTGARDSVISMCRSFFLPQPVESTPSETILAESMPDRICPLLFVLACLLQTCGVTLDWLDCAAPFLCPGMASDIWEAALLVFLSAIIACPVRLEFGELLPLLDRFDLSTWYAFAEAKSSLPFSRLAKMSVIATMIIAVARLPGFDLRLLRQMTRLTSFRAEFSVGGLEACFLPFDGMDIQIAFSYFCASVDPMSFDLTGLSPHEKAIALTPPADSLTRSAPSYADDHLLRYVLTFGSSRSG
jgi:hypothetical protein